MRKMIPLVRLDTSTETFLSSRLQRVNSPMKKEPDSPPTKRARLDADKSVDQQQPSSSTNTNGSMSRRPSSSSTAPLPPLSLSILGTEPLDEFILDIADFIHQMIMTRPPEQGKIEVEAKIGVLKDRVHGQRLVLPVRVETSAPGFFFPFRPQIQTQSHH
jgi:polynucleotide 5'-triphosphatase